jgi:hypothetical protein
MPESFTDDGYVTTFEHGLAQYYDHNFQGATETFQFLKKIDFNDRVLDFYLNKCVGLSDKKLPENWNAIEVFEY